MKRNKPEEPDDIEPDNKERYIMDIITKMGDIPTDMVNEIQEYLFDRKEPVQLSDWARLVMYFSYKFKDLEENIPLTYIKSPEFIRRIQWTGIIHTYGNRNMVSTKMLLPPPVISKNVEKMNLRIEGLIYYKTHGMNPTDFNQGSLQLYNQLCIFENLIELTLETPSPYDLGTSDKRDPDKYSSKLLCVPFIGPLLYRLLDKYYLEQNQAKLLPFLSDNSLKVLRLDHFANVFRTPAQDWNMVHDLTHLKALDHFEFTNLRQTHDEIPSHYAPMSCLQIFQLPYDLPEKPNISISMYPIDTNSYICLPVDVSKSPYKFKTILVNFSNGGRYGGSYFHDIYSCKALHLDGAAVADRFVNDPQYYTDWDHKTTYDPTLHWKKIKHLIIKNVSFERRPQGSIAFRSHKIQHIECLDEKVMIPGNMEDTFYGFIDTRLKSKWNHGLKEITCYPDALPVGTKDLAIKLGIKINYKLLDDQKQIQTKIRAPEMANPFLLHLRSIEYLKDVDQMVDDSDFIESAQILMGTQ